MATAASLPVTGTSLVPPPAAERRVLERALPGIKKAAILVVAVGDELGKKILQNLPDADVQRLTEEIADLRNVPPEMSLQVMEEFFDMLETQRYMMHGGLDYATKLLVESFGKQRAEDLLALVKRAQEASQGDLAMLQKVDPQQLGKFLDGEHPQTVALVLAHLDPKRASLVLNSLSEEQKVAVVRRLAEMRQFSPEMAQKVAVILHKRLETVGDTGRKAYAGFKAVADLLNRLDAEQAKKILEEIEEEEPEVAINIRNLMFTFEDLVTVPSASMRDLVAAIDKAILAMALKGAREDVRAHIFRAIR
ncbi:flagellar motor switch protein FliG [Acidobacterium sp. S8]|uniref:flagellar motor switch protein FliG n=1 Tax=Acidobacterium sp. S8 TaxID=1641854 RepID=UPI00131D1FF3|nr:flagellar motor switch protein FliG [Acidobacterium sp. S8]